MFNDAEVAASQGATLIGNKIRAAIAAHGRACLALSGGRTPWNLMRALASKKLSWREVHIFQTDERVVSLGDPERNLMHLREALLSHVPLLPEHVHAMPVDETDLVGAARRYGRLLKRIAGAPAVLDLVHLGLGSDGHTASLVPDDPVLDVLDADVGVTDAYRGQRRMTLTYPILNRAEAIIWLVAGDAKAELLRRLCAGDKQIPAGRVNRDRATVVADEAAARLLQKDMCKDSGHAT